MYILLLLFLFAGCGAEKQMVVIPKKMTPEWYMHPPLSTTTALYAVGDGQNKEEAISNALSLMVATLSVSIASQFSAKTVVKEGALTTKDATYTNRVQSDVQKIRISNYKLLESEKLGFKNYIVLIKLNKQKLFLSMKKEIDMNFELYEQKAEELSKTDALKLLAFYKSESDKLHYLQNMLLVMGVLNQKFSSESYLKKIKDVTHHYENLLLKISFSIRSNTAASNLKPVIAKGLSAKKYRIKDERSIYHFTVYIQSNIEQASAYGFTLARTAIFISTKDYKGSIIASNKLNITGQSGEGFAIAKENVAFRLNNLVEKEGIKKVLGM